MNTLLLGTLQAPSKYKEYIEYIQQLQNEGLVYRKEIVDDLIDRFLEVVDDNYHIKELYTRKKVLVSGVPESDEISAMIVAMQNAANSSESVISAQNSNADSWHRINSSLDSAESNSYVLEMGDTSQLEVVEQTADAAMNLSRNKAEKTSPLLEAEGKSFIEINDDGKEHKIAHTQDNHRSKSEADVSSMHADALNGTHTGESKKEEIPLESGLPEHSSLNSNSIAKYLAAARTIKTPHDPTHLQQAANKKHLANSQLLKIKEEFSEISAYAISILLIMAQIEDLLCEETKQ
ncbi:hypothetical protein NEMIN01_2007 [Nematocida minor]|uniref:uncharacterized protein n=1 Tax=Nematocida minor TaxID=1912983 RepID=UPI00221FAEDE|nr:uncharacterized protein NEMIN01_2007 [Nematocida minor]KAI5192420.1 hypothetical protein NEMIN01_2007 [Nematocida minor]